MCFRRPRRTLVSMFQGIKELRRAPGRAALITVTIGLIAVLVTFLSSLTAGLGHQSVSALRAITDSSTTLLVADNGATPLSASRVSPTLASEVGGTPLHLLRERIGETPAIILSDPHLTGTEVRANATIPATDVSIGGREIPVTGAQDLWLDHLPVVTVAPGLLAASPEPPVGVLVDAPIPPPAGTTALTGDDILKTSASYVGENLSLTTMTTLLFLISALVVGAFFTVWTIQRMGAVAVTFALGAATKVVVADAFSQALAVLLLGVGAGTALTLAVGNGAPAALPIELSWSTTALPAGILVLCGLVGAAFSLIPILRVDPRTALAQA